MGNILPDLNLHVPPPKKNVVICELEYVCLKPGACSFLQVFTSDGVYVQEPQAGGGGTTCFLNHCSTVAYIMNIEESLQHKLLTQTLNNIHSNT
jgi:hypothetical protein